MKIDTYDGNIDTRILTVANVTATKFDKTGQIILLELPRRSFVKVMRWKSKNRGELIYYSMRYEYMQTRTDAFYDEHWIVGRNYQCRRRPVLNQFPVIKYKITWIWSPLTVISRRYDDSCIFSMRRDRTEASFCIAVAAKSKLPDVVLV